MVWHGIYQALGQDAPELDGLYSIVCPAGQFSLQPHLGYQAVGNDGSFWDLGADVPGLELTFEDYAVVIPDTADVSGISDDDGLTNVAFSYQWLADGADISGATDSSYTLGHADEGKAITVTVSFTDDSGNGESLTSAATDAVEARPNSPATGQPTTSETAQVGETLTADTSGIADDDGLDNVSFAYQWQADCAAVQDATDVAYTPVVDDIGKAISVQVSFSDDAGHAESLTSAATGAVEARPNSPATGAPSINGTALVGETLTADISGIADEDGLDNAVFGYQWISNDAGADSEISGATDSAYRDPDSGTLRLLRAEMIDAEATKALRTRPAHPQEAIATDA